MFAAVLDDAGRQRALDDGPIFKEDLNLVLDRHAETREFELLIACADTDDGPSTSLDVEHCDFLRDAQGIVQRQNDDAGTELDALGPSRCIRGHHQGRRRNGVVRKMVLGEPGDVEACFFGLLHHIPGIGEHAASTARMVAQRHQADQAEFHRKSSFVDASAVDLIAGSRRDWLPVSGQGIRPSSKSHAPSDCSGILREVV